MTDDREELEAHARMAVLVTRSDLPAPAADRTRSFFGGLPQLPDNVDWPIAEVRGVHGTETVALTFMAQIDLAELPRSAVRSLLPSTGTLYFFCSSIFEDEGRPPCRIFYHPGRADALAPAKPPQDLMVLGGEGGGYHVKWLDPARDVHAKVEFKYTLSFRPFRDFAFKEDPVGGELLARSLCEVLGPGDPKEPDLLANRRADDFAADEDWPFNGLLMTYATRSVLGHVRSDLAPSSYRKPLDDDTKQILRGFEASANSWLEQCERSVALQSVDPSTRAAFRTWWVGIARSYAEFRGRVWTYPHQFPKDIAGAINHTIRHMAAHGDPALAPAKYVDNLRKANRWKAPTARDGQYRFFSTAVHQIGGYGNSWQDAPEEHRAEVLLLQIHGDETFLGWHANSGCVLHFWIARDALAALDFSAVEATFECD